ncbi:hypothetical protein PN499_28605 [Kamptonema animale CS-326]|nr:hypothetical protein [Kamptonema animale]MDB9515167.1 hypothetical protein [Kamptonema animale CS-326]
MWTSEKSDCDATDVSIGNLMRSAQENCDRSIAEVLQLVAG